MNDSRVWLSAHHFLSITRGGENDINGKMLMLKRKLMLLSHESGGGPRLVVSTAAFHARARGSFPGFGGLKETKMFIPHPLVKLSIVGASVTER